MKKDWMTPELLFEDGRVDHYMLFHRAAQWSEGITKDPIHEKCMELVEQILGEALQEPSASSAQGSACEFVLVVRGWRCIVHDVTVDVRTKPTICKVKTKHDELRAFVERVADLHTSDEHPSAKQLDEYDRDDLILEARTLLRGAK